MERIPADYGADEAPDPRSLPRAMVRGTRGRCPACGRGGLFRAYLKVRDACPACGEDLSHQRADDAPPYVTIFVVGHLLLAAVVGVDIAYAWPLWLHAAVWVPLTVVSCLLLLPVAKGALVGLQWALRMHGFGDAVDETGLSSTAPPARHRAATLPERLGAP